MGLAFWITLAAGMAVLALFDHSITARWSLGPIQGAHFWWVVLTSPEILIFLFFMLTDPRTVPAGRVARIMFGVLVGGLGSLLMAPWQTEFGVKVGLLVSLAIACASRPLLERRLPQAGTADDDPRQVGRRAARWPTASAHCGGGGRRVCTLQSPRQASRRERPTSHRCLIVSIAEVDPASLPVVSVDPRGRGDQFPSRLADGRPGAGRDLGLQPRGRTGGAANARRLAADSRRPRRSARASCRS